MKKHAFTLVELLVVTIIIGILGSIALPQFLVTQERALDNEARATLRMMRAAERTRRMETGTYVALASNGAINTNLRLDLSTAGTRSWNFITTATGATDCCAQATRFNGPDARTFRMRIADFPPAAAAPDDPPAPGGTCP